VVAIAEGDTVLPNSAAGIWSALGGCAMEAGGKADSIAERGGSDLIGTATTLVSAATVLLKNFGIRS
jgi:hypothetical protein